MKCSELLLFLVFIPHLLFGQEIFLDPVTTSGYSTNLVGNGSFEQGDDQCSWNGSANDFNSVIYGWYTPNSSTPDIHSVEVDQSCLTAQPTTTGFDIYCPTETGVGSQLPSEGNRFAGAIFYSVISNPTLPQVYREFLQIKLNRELRAGYAYEISFKISLAENSKYSVSKMGFGFSRFPVSHINTGVVDPDTIIEFEGNLDDTVNWVQFKDTVVFNQSFSYLTIGNFENNEQTTIAINDSVSCYHSAYYFIDEVSIKPIICKDLATDQTDIPCYDDTPTIQMPELITPNGDGVNDDFSPVVLKELVNLTFDIYNRWGEKVNAVYDGNWWDGTYGWSSELCPVGVYYWVATFEFQGSFRQSKGFVQVVY